MLQKAGKITTSDGFQFNLQKDIAYAMGARTAAGTNYERIQRGWIPFGVNRVIWFAQLPASPKNSAKYNNELRKDKDGKMTLKETPKDGELSRKMLNELEKLNNGTPPLAVVFGKEEDNDAYSFLGEFELIDGDASTPGRQFLLWERIREEAQVM